MLKSSYSSQTLTVGQEILAGKLDAFLKGPDFCFIIKGYAGTGKTFMLRGLARALHASQRPCRLMAPTGRAAKILRERTGLGAETIHRAIYCMDSLKEYRERGEDGTETFKFYFDLDANRDSVATVYVVDEASMVADHYQEAEFFRFGSGRLLADLVKFIHADHNDHAKKLILVGDPAQLPPVGSVHSPALDPEYLRVHLGIEAGQYELTETVRQRAGSGILAHATRVREALRLGDYRVLDVQAKYADVLPIAPQPVIDRYLDVAGGQAADRVVVVAMANRTVRDYNRAIRARLFPGAKAPVAGDRLIVVANNYAHGYEILNGDFAVIREVSARVEERTHRIRSGREGSRALTPVRLAFRDVRLRLDGGGDGLEVTCKILDSLLDADERDVTSDENRALFVDFKTRHPALKPGTPDFRQAIRKDPYFNALRAKYGYAVTCHKAQGGEWPHVIVDFSTSASQLSEAYFRWAYTAITRARDVLHVVNEPRHRLDTPLRPSPPVDSAERTDLLRLDSASGSTADWVAAAVAGVVQAGGIKVSGFRKDAYRGDVVLERGGATARFKVHFNRRNRITGVERMGADAGELAAAAEELLSTLVGKELLAGSASAGTPIRDPGKSTGHTHMDDFLREVAPRLQAGGIAVLDAIAPTQHHLRVAFGAGGEKVSVDYYFDGKKRYTRCIPDGARSTSTEVLGRVVAITAGHPNDRRAAS